MDVSVAIVARDLFVAILTMSAMRLAQAGNLRRMKLEIANLVGWKILG